MTLSAPLKKSFAHAHALNAPVLDKVHEERRNQIVGVVPEGEMGQPVPPAYLEQPCAAQHGTVETGGIAAVFRRMPARAVIRDFDVARNAVFRQILDERRVVFRIKAGIQMDRHDVEPERHDALAPPGATSSSTQLSTPPETATPTFAPGPTIPVRCMAFPALLTQTCCA